MDHTLAIQLTVIVLASAALLSAAVSDYRKREVSDRYWIIIGVLGPILNLLSGLDEGGFGWELPVSTFAGILFLISVIFLPDRAGLLVCASAVFCSVAVLFSGCQYYLAVASSASVILCALFLFAYWFGIIRGGADVKCLMSISLAFPVYPSFCDLSGVPPILKTVFPPSTSVLFTASLLSVLGCTLFCLLKNRGFVSIRGYYEDVNSARNAFVWPCERMVDGKLKRCSIPDDEDIESIYDELEKSGVQKVFVTPMVPFIVPIFVGFLITFFFGNPMFSLGC